MTDTTDKPKTTDAEKTKKTAYHEAGHAVVACLLGYKIEKVSIISDGESSGRVILEPLNPELIDKLERCESELAPPELIQETHSLAVGSMMIDISGLIAQSHFLKELTPAGTSADMKHVKGLMDALKAPEITFTIFDAVATMIEKEWPCIVALAEALLEHKELDGERVRKLVYATANRTNSDTQPSKT